MGRIDEGARRQKRIRLRIEARMDSLMRHMRLEKWYLKSELIKKWPNARITCKAMNRLGCMEIQLRKWDKRRRLGPGVWWKRLTPVRVVICDRTEKGNRDETVNG